MAEWRTHYLLQYWYVLYLAIAQLELFWLFEELNEMQSEIFWLFWTKDLLPLIALEMWLIRRYCIQEHFYILGHLIMLVSNIIQGEVWAYSAEEWFQQSHAESWSSMKTEVILCFSESLTQITTVTSSMQVLTQCGFLPFVNPLEPGIAFVAILFFFRQKWPYKNERV